MDFYLYNIYKLQCKKSECIRYILFIIMFLFKQVYMFKLLSMSTWPHSTAATKSIWDLIADGNVVIDLFRSRSAGGFLGQVPLEIGVDNTVQIDDAMACLDADIAACQ